MSEHKGFLKMIYDRTNDDKRMKVYNMVNVASVLLGIRTGAILYSSLNKDDLPQIQMYLQEYGVSSKLYPVPSKPLFIVKNSVGDAKAAFNRIEEFKPIPIGIPDPNEPPGPSPQELAAKRNKKDRNTGIALGYLTPIALKNAAANPISVEFSIKVNTPDGAVTSQFFPQRVSGEIQTHKAKLNEMKTALETHLPTVLPDGFTLESVTLVEKEVPAFGGGRRQRRSKRMSSRRRRLTKRTRGKRT